MSMFFHAQFVRCGFPSNFKHDFQVEKMETFMFCFVQIYLSLPKKDFGMHQGPGSMNMDHGTEPVE